jgi:hypothetical protein
MRMHTRTVLDKGEDAPESVADPDWRLTTTINFGVAPVNEFLNGCAVGTGPRGAVLSPPMLRFTARPCMYN